MENNDFQILLVRKILSPSTTRAFPWHIACPPFPTHDFSPDELPHYTNGKFRLIVGKLWNQWLNSHLPVSKGDIYIYIYIASSWNGLSIILFPPSFCPVLFFSSPFISTYPPTFQATFHITSRLSHLFLLCSYFTMAETAIERGKLISEGWDVNITTFILQ